MAARAAIDLLARCYEKLDLEVIVVDDGSPQPFHAPAGLPWEVRVIPLDRKADPRNPCVPLNVGVSAARGEYIALSCVEILHRRGPVLAEMRERLKAMDDHFGARRMGYVTAACWSPDEKRWHAHSAHFPVEIEGVTLPGSYHFLSMLHRNLWTCAGGFDADYRDGAGYEDSDFLMRLQQADAHIRQCDDLVVEHPRKGTRAAWTREMHERNRQVFRSKWC